MVRGLVEHQIVGPTKQDVRELDSASFATGQRVQRDERTVRRESESREDPIHVRLCPIPICFAERELGVREAANGAISGVVFHVAAERLEPLTLDVESPSGKHVRHGDVLRPCSVGARVLRQESQRARHLRRPARRRAVADDRAQKGGLARAISSHETDLLARVDRQRGVIDDDTPGNLDRQRLGSEHSSRPYRSRPKPLARYPPEQSHWLRATDELVVLVCSPRTSAGFISRC